MGAPVVPGLFIYYLFLLFLFLKKLFPLEKNKIQRIPQFFCQKKRKNSCWEKKNKTLTSTTRHDTQKYS
jgi:hypothetical protein